MLRQPEIANRKRDRLLCHPPAVKQFVPEEQFIPTDWKRAVQLMQPFVLAEVPEIIRHLEHHASLSPYFFLGSRFIQFAQQLRFLARWYVAPDPITGLIYCGTPFDGEVAFKKEVDEVKKHATIVWIGPELVKQKKTQMALQKGSLGNQPEKESPCSNVAPLLWPPAQVREEEKDPAFWDEMINNNQGVVHDKLAKLFSDLHQCDLKGDHRVVATNSVIMIMAQLKEIKKENVKLLEGSLALAKLHQGRLE